MIIVVASGRTNSIAGYCSVHLSFYSSRFGPIEASCVYIFTAPMLHGLFQRQLVGIDRCPGFLMQSYHFFRIYTCNCFWKSYCLHVGNQILSHGKRRCFSD